jgi:protein TonB
MADDSGAAVTPDPTTTGRFDRLSAMLFVAVLAHGIVILGVTFAPNPIAEPKSTTSINVTLLIDSANVDADVEDAELLATRDQAGSGEDESLRPTRTLSAEQLRTLDGKPEGTDAVDAEMLEAGAPADQLLSRNSSDRTIEAKPQTTDRPSRQPMTAAALLQLDSPFTLAAEIDDLVVDPNSDAADIAGPTTREAAVSAYMVSWRQRVERIGTANFPLESLGHRHNQSRPVVEVAIDADGSLREAVLLRSSGNSRLDAAALSILELSAPFDPLPASVLADHGGLRFAYEWDFLTGRD